MNGFDQAWRSASPPGSRSHAPADTPPGAEDRIQELSDALEDNETALIAAADEELDAQGALDDAVIMWRLDETCPQAGTVDGKRILASYVDAWVAAKTKPQRDALRVAKQRRQAAEKQRDRISRQLMAAQSIAKSVGEAYRGTGRWGT